MRFIIREVVYFTIGIFQKIKNRKLRIDFRAKTTINSKFGGYNKLSHHSYFSGELGLGSYVGENSIVGGKIGKYCSIAGNVIFLTKTHPTSSFVSTSPCFYSTKCQNGISYVSCQKFDEQPKLEGEKYSVVVGNDVYIGYGATVIGPVRIGDGAIVAANATVVNDVEPYTIVGGTPAKVIRKRFSDEEIDFLLKLKWWDKDETWIIKNAEHFDSVEDLRKVLSEE